MNNITTVLASQPQEMARQRLEVAGIPVPEWFEQFHHLHMAVAADTRGDVQDTIHHAREFRNRACQHNLAHERHCGEPTNKYTDQADALLVGCGVNL